MPLTLRDPRPGKTPNYSIRGTYLGVYVETTAGTADKTLARKFLRDIERAIERGEYRAPEAVAAEPPREPTFADAALAYLQANGDPKGLSAIVEATGPHALRDVRLADIDQIAIDRAARALYPEAPATTLNRMFYTPVSAVLKRAGIERKIRRPKGWRGSKATSWLDAEPAFKVLAECYRIEYEFGLFCTVLLYCGPRLSEALRPKLRDLRLDMTDRHGKPTPLLYIPDTKNGEPRPLHLPPHVAQAFRKAPPRAGRPRRAAGQASDGREPGKPGARLPNGAAGRSRTSAGVPFLDRHPDERLFRFRKGGRLYKMLALAMKRAGVSFPRRQGAFHLFSHTYGTWMKRFGGLDTYGLTRTGRWKDPASADRYNHTEASWEARQADRLPVPARGRSA